MVVIIDDCRECRYHFTHYGSVVLCSFNDMTTVRHVFEAPWGPVLVMNCPLADAAELHGGPED